MEGVVPGGGQDRTYRWEDRALIPAAATRGQAHRADPGSGRGGGGDPGLEEEHGGPVGPFADLEAICIDAGMPTARFCTFIGMSERTWRRRWQAKARAEQPAKGPWPQPVRDSANDTVVAHATKHTARGHRKIWAMTRRDGVTVSASAVMRALRDKKLLQSADYQRERRQLAAARKTAFLTPPTGPNEVWQLGFSDFQTTTGGTWRIAGCRDYVIKFESS